MGTPIKGPKNSEVKYLNIFSSCQILENLPSKLTDHFVEKKNQKTINKTKS